MTAIATKPKGLGKGLSALMSDSYSQTVSDKRTAPVSSGASKHAEAVLDAGDKAITSGQIAIEKLEAGIYQPRRRFTEEYLHELADSIEKNGIMQPILVRPSPKNKDRFEIIAGERRFRAAKLAKLTTVPVIIRALTDKQALELALVENIQRQDLSPLEEASGYQRLMDEFEYTQEELASTVGKSRSHIANLLRLQSLPDAIKLMVDKGELSAGHARALLGVDNAELLAKRIVAEGLSVRQTEQLVKPTEKRLEQIANAIEKNAIEKPTKHLVGKALSSQAATPTPAQPAVPTLSLDAPPSSSALSAVASLQENTAPMTQAFATESALSTPSTQESKSEGKSEDVLELEAMLSQNLGLHVSINSAGYQKGEVVIGYNSLMQLDEILRRLGGGA